MQTAEPSPKDPTVAVMLSLFFPGLGHAYAGNPTSFLAFLLLEIMFFAWGWWFAFLAVHVFQTIAAGGAARQWNQRRAAAADAGIPPPPPPGAAVAAAAAPRAPVVPLPAALPERPPELLDADTFLIEIEDAWREHRSAESSAREFADRKWRAIRSLRVEHAEDGPALVAAARDLASAGVLTSEEVGQLEARVSA